MPHEFLQLGRLTIFRALSSSHRCGLVGLKDVRWRLQSVTHPSPSHQEVFILCGDDQLATIATCEWNGIPFSSGYRRYAVFTREMLLVYSIFVFFQKIQGRKNQREHHASGGAPLAANIAIDDGQWHMT
ncbi:uncharacterized protein LACBIDRAFT_331669 [Laccaria bicolor S238N-H82]|uniref:Predicted protein n=1 Tax=Laccaria bicolor (strain S238N-H82 / ATCC MYA-4686) TaxID=486041 RepID=B0DQ68_LACBS|nr:uncharacterized protein LACBIDRAFT_331669 [Laccaria bicolor S238N-H82]EDR03332.1 predicted protein [Laccaria bicolor S238N-H82]|eukprot:XP_001886128.1 predicted protein [Laccaria bicolor S238N-H82]